VAGSKPTERVVRILELLRGHPGAGLRFSDLARDGGLSQATCHSILVTLADAGYVVRDAEALTYRLGPAALALGAAAGESFADVRAARPELEALSARTGLPVSAATVVDGAITVIDLVGAGARPSPIQVGTSVPLAPPFGAIHVAWSGERAVDEWIARAPRPTLTPERLRAVIRDHQATHLAVAPHTTTSVELRAALGELAADALARDVRERTLDLLAAIDELDYTAAVLANADRLPVNTLTAPVFDATARPAYAVALHVREPDVDIARIEELGQELLGATRRLTAALGGDEPPRVEAIGELAGARTGGPA
jgi:DNA-binding IclR family transcriptional regulator